MTPIFRNLRVVGYRFLPVKQKNLHDSLKLGDPLELRPVTDNEHDEYAVEVHYAPGEWMSDVGPTFIGYLPRTVSAAVHHLSSTHFWFLIRRWEVKVSNITKNGQLDLNLNIEEK